MWRLPLFVTSSFSGGSAITKNKNIEHVNDSSVQHLHTINYYPVNRFQ